MAYQEMRLRTSELSLLLPIMSTSVSHHFSLIQSNIFQLIVSLAVLYPIVIFLVKLSIFLLYLRLFGVSRPFRYLVYAGLIFQAMFYASWLGLEIASTVICSTVENLTRPLCTANVPLVVSQGAVNVVTDLDMLALPIPQVLRLQTQTRRKLGLVAIFLAWFM